MLNPRSKDSCYLSIVDNDKKVLQTVSNAACYWANIPLCTVSAAHISLSQIAPPMPNVQCLQLSIDNITAIKTMTAHHQQAPTTTTALWEILLAYSAHSYK